MSNIFWKRQFFTKNQNFYIFLSHFHWKKCSFVTEPYFLILRLMKDFKTFFRVKLAEKYTHGRIFEKKYSKKVKNAKFVQNHSIFGQKWPKTGLFSKWAQQTNSRPSFLDSAFNLGIGTSKASNASFS